MACTKPPGVTIRVLVMHDSEHKPSGGDYYIARKKKNVVAPCKFVKWRRSLVLDFIDMMDAALSMYVYTHVLVFDFRYDGRCVEYVCMYIRMCVCRHTHARTHTHTHTQTFLIYMYTYLDIYI